MRTGAGKIVFLLSQAILAKTAITMSKETLNLWHNKRESVSYKKEDKVVLFSQHTFNSIVENSFSNRNGKSNKV